MSGWDGNINSPHTMQDEYELSRELGGPLTTDEDGQLVAQGYIFGIPIPDDDRCTGTTSVDDGVTRHSGPCPIHPPAPGAYEGYTPTQATCPECGRVFDLLDPDDAGEWFYGHDCEVQA